LKSTRSRTIRRNRDPDFHYNTPVAKHKQKPNRKVKQQKKKDMKSCPEQMFGDYGDYYCEIGQEPFPENSVSRELLDIQFFTSRPMLWTKAILEYCTQQYNRREIPNPPELFKQGTGNQIKIKDEGIDLFSNYLTIFLYDNGTTLIQGTNFEEWCYDHLHKVKMTIQMPSTPPTLPEKPMTRSTKNNTHERTTHNYYATLKVNIPKSPVYGTLCPTQPTCIGSTQGSLGTCSSNSFCPSSTSTPSKRNSTTTSKRNSTTASTDSNTQSSNSQTSLSLVSKIEQLSLRLGSERSQLKITQRNLQNKEEELTILNSEVKELRKIVDKQKREVKKANNGRDNAVREKFSLKKKVDDLESELVAHRLANTSDVQSKHGDDNMKCSTATCTKAKQFFSPILSLYHLLVT
jgi:hypothetical protein